MEMLDLRNKVDNVSSLIDSFFAEGVFPLLIKLYPNLDGVINEEQEANMMLLRDSLMALANICDLGVERLCEALEAGANDDD